MPVEFRPTKDYDLAGFVLDMVEQIDLSPFEQKDRVDGVGNSAFQPPLMAARLRYSYRSGERSSRRLKKHSRDDIADKAITAS